MQHIHFCHIVLLIAATFGGGCGVYYNPGRIPTPHFDSTHDTYLDAAYGVGGWQMDIVAAPMDHLWVAGHLAYLPYSDTVEEILHPVVVNSYNGTSLGQLHGEFGVGWYSGPGGQFSLLAGYGRGRSSFIRLKDYTGYGYIHDTVEYATEIGRGDFETYFLQVSVPAINTASNAYARLLLRGEYIGFRQFTLDGITQPLPNVLLIEPRLFIGAPIPGTPDLQFEVQMGFQCKAEGREEFEFQPFHISVALMGLLDLL